MQTKYLLRLPLPKFHEPVYRQTIQWKSKLNIWTPKLKIRIALLDRRETKQKEQK